MNLWKQASVRGQCTQGQPRAHPHSQNPPRLEDREGRLGHGQVAGNMPLLSGFLTESSLSLSPSRFYPVSRRVPEYYSPYSSQFPDDYQYYPPGVRPDSICSMPAYDRVSPPWALEDKRHSFRNGGGPAFQLREWKEPAGLGRPDGTVWIPSPSRQPVYYEELDAASGSLRRLSLQPRSHSVPRSPGQGSYSRSRVYSPARSPRAHFERLPPRSEDIYADPAAYVMRRSISSPKVSPPRLPRLPQPLRSPGSLRPSVEKTWRGGGVWGLWVPWLAPQDQRCLLGRGR